MVDADVVKGGVVSAETKAEFDSLRAVFDTKTAMDRLDSYGKWLFGSAAIVGSLGAGLSNAALSQLHGLGTWLFALAVLAFGACLVSASLSIAPQWVEVKIDDLKSLRQAVNSQFQERQKYLTMATVFFAAALALAALAPFLSLVGNKTAPVLHYSVDEKRKLVAGLEATGLKPGTIGELRIEGATAPVGMLPSSSATVDDSGQLKLTLQIEDTAHLAGKPELVSCLKLPGETKCFDSRRILVPK